MKNPLCIATGNLWRAKLSADQAVLHLSRFAIDGIELTISRIAELLDFSLSKKTIKILNQYKYNSLHAPFHLVTDAKNDREIIEEIGILNHLYKLINARTMVVHPGQLTKPQLLRKFTGHICTENMPPKHGLKISDYVKMLKQFPKMGFCLDISHAYLVSLVEIEQIVKKFPNRITQIHFSGAYRRHEHSSIRPAPLRFIKSIQPIKELNVPIVLEGDIYSDRPSELQKEIRATKKIIDKL